MWMNIKSVPIHLISCLMCIKDFQIDAIICGPDEHPVYPQYPVIGTCEPCTGTRSTIRGLWSQCSVTCGHGSQNRIITSITRCGAQSQTTESRSCHQPICPVNGAWSSWGQFTPCDKSCGEGIQVRFRTCTNPSPSTGGQPCNGDSLQTASCNTQLCPKLVTLTNPTASALRTLPPDPASESPKQHKRHFLPSHLKTNKE
ncbi:properdin-like isoform X1 [Crassostrea virginica]